MARDDAQAETIEGALLAGFKGAAPPAPQWFLNAVAAPYETRAIDVDGAQISYQHWKNPGAPGLLFVHGNAAHGHWWDFIAPFFREHFSVVSITQSGMGDSGWRSAYSFRGFAAEQMAVCEAAGLFDAAQKPVIAAHSFGGFIASCTAAHHGARFGGVIMLDSAVRPPEEPFRGPSGAGRPHRIYPSLAAALARFRLAPPQPCSELYAVDYIARWSLKRVEGGLSWKFDPNLWAEFKPDEDLNALIRARQCRMSFVRGEQSALIDARIWRHMQAVGGADCAYVSVPEAQHHLLLDQPLATVTAIRAQLAAWNYWT